MSLDGDFCAMRLPAACVVLILLSGCASAAKPLAPSDPASREVPVEPKRHVVLFTGQIPLSAVESMGHQRPAEDLLWPASQPGVLFNVTARPSGMEVLIDTGGINGGVVGQPAEWMIMLHSHKAHGTNVYVEHVSAWTNALRTCIRVPAADLAAGTWQVMVHTRNVYGGGYNLFVSTWGVAGKVLDERHGHRAEDGAFSVDRHGVEPCADRNLPQPTA